MPTVMLENISVELYQQLEQGAHVHQRSVSNESVSYLEQMLRQREHAAEAILARARAVRQKTAHARLTDDLLMRAKNEGRL